MVVAILDADWIKYTASAAGEKRSINVIHKSSGREKQFKTRTEFYGRDKAKSGGWLAEVNKGRETPFTADDFMIEDIQTPEPIENVLHTAKMMYEGAVKAVGATSHKGYLGEGDSFRVELSTILKYKGQRPALKPVYLQDVTDYLIKKFKCEVVTGIEADDKCVIEAYKKKDHVVVAVDKDSCGCPTLLYNPNHPENGIMDCDYFGNLFLNEKDDVKGYGRLWLYFQVCSGDAVDNYAANSASDVTWGPKSAYKRLAHCKNDKEAWQAMVDIYKHLYPEPKVVTGWRGDEITVDWLYMLKENFAMARMLRWEGDVVEVEDVLNRMEVAAS